MTVWYVAIMPAFLLLIGLALDGGHLFVVRTEIQAVADGAARAAASQLDTSASSPLRADPTSPARLDTAAADRLARAYAASQGATVLNVTVDQQHVEVGVGRDVPTVFLRIAHRYSFWMEARGVAHPRRN